MSMADVTHASLESQLGNAACTIEDSEEMFWLRESDDYASRVKLGNFLSGQYRFGESAQEYTDAMKIRSDDPMLHIRLAGTYLTLRRFNEAMDEYRRSLSLGMSEKTAAYPMGVWYYLREDYKTAAEWFEKCLPCGDEMAIAVIYWHTLSCYRAGLDASLLQTYHADMKVGHHTAYCLAVSVFAAGILPEDAATQIESNTDNLNYVISMYGLCGYLEHIGKQVDAQEYLQKLLARDSIWPCISYLAAWNDRALQESDLTKRTSHI
ncbi:hypothetical protein SDC9_48133 [bioreactor metagenome]|uniref:Tetratricopeptide repeat protein n=1 Tax=bioreactor metagenome TaxID=1076179 RepID=A0A644WH96_9ZZZZ